jgi:CRP/FNR family transcriptional regulator, cyclic AMP receptor protein
VRLFSTLGYLRRLSLLQDFTPAEVLTVARMMDLRALERHDRVFQMWEPTGHLYVVLEGRLKSYRRHRVGRQVTLAFLKPGDVFGEEALTAGAVHEQGVEALQSTTIGALAAGEFRALIEQKPVLALRVLQNLGQQKGLLERKIADLVFKDVPTRLAEMLLGLAEDSGEACTHGFALDWRITQQDLADLIGATRPAVNATLRQFRERGLIYPRPHVICVTDREGLRRVAEVLGETI